MIRVHINGRHGFEFNGNVEHFSTGIEYVRVSGNNINLSIHKDNILGTYTSNMHEIDVEKNKKN